ncbi:hypothetical protein FCV25MIE_01530 [Fagus crenata]
MELVQVQGGVDGVSRQILCTSVSSGQDKVTSLDKLLVTSLQQECCTQGTCSSKWDPMTPPSLESSHSPKERPPALVIHTGLEPFGTPAHNLSPIPIPLAQPNTQTIKSNLPPFTPETLPISPSEPISPNLHTQPA